MDVHDLEYCKLYLGKHQDDMEEHHRNLLDFSMGNFQRIGSWNEFIIRLLPMVKLSVSRNDISHIFLLH